MANSVRRFFAFCLGLASALAPLPCLAWGAEGHRVIAEIAAAELTPAARREVTRLLGGRDAATVMAEESTWADDVAHSRSETAPWHFVDIPVGSRGYDAARDCPHAACVVAQIGIDEAVLADVKRPLPVRAEALRFLIHFVGDIHQPLHAANRDDRGGNAVRVHLRGHLTNLHSIWDTEVVRTLGSNADRVAAQLDRAVAPADRSRWAQGDAVDWANESFAIASREIYAAPQLRRPGRTVVLAPGYPEHERPFVAVQLEKGGLRLAAVLNRILR